tara:strand:- start:158 stop:463 length:306 start_codon:yes stop_codon:yes gene_type:complete
MAIRNEQEKFLSNLSDKADVADGKHGAFFIKDTGAHTGKWGSITMIENTVFGTLTASNWSGGAPAAETFPEGLTIYGDFSAITLASGACIAYFSTSDTTAT